jgi:arabinose-5-phosphate isomerase
MSKSGFTKEIVELVPYLQNRSARTVACVSQENSPLEKICELSITLKVARELDQHNLVPTISTEVQLIFGDILTVALMQSKNIGLDLYAANHPSGSIGKKLLTKVDELMLLDDQLPLCSPTSKIKDVLVELSMKNCGCVLVADESKRLQGIFTDGDLRRSLQKIGTVALDKKVEDLMSVKPVCVDKKTLAYEAKKAMQKEDNSWINVVPVVEDQQVIGLLRLHDLIKAGI